MERIRKFFQDDLWNFPLDREKGLRKLFFKILRIGYLSIRGFIQDKCSLSASSLTYYTLMSILPIFALLFAIANGFGYRDYLRDQLLQNFQDQNAVLVEMFKYSDQILEQAKGGLVAGIGLGILFWTVCLLLNNLERILNQIWGAKKTRSWRRIFSDYFALMLIGPFFFIVFNSVAVYVVSKAAILVKIIPYILFSCLFTFFYLFLPNIKVRFTSAILGGFFGGCLYLIGQWGYIYFQVGVSRYGAIYGSMAALPLFLIWVQLSWFLFLFGAEISYAHQSLEEHEFEREVGKISQNFKTLISLWIVHMAVSRFQKGDPPLSRELLVKRYQIPVALTNPILQELVDCNLLLKVENGYVPARAVEHLRISDVLQALDRKGMNEFPFLEAKLLAPFEKILERFRKQIEESKENGLLKDVSHTI